MVSRETAGVEEVRLPAPCKILVIAPRYVGVDTEAHLQSLREILERRVSAHYSNGDYLAVVADRPRLAARLLGMRPHIVYFYGHGMMDGGQPCLALGGAGTVDPLAVVTLRGMLADPLPRVIFLNGCQTEGGGWQGAGAQLVERVPCVIANRTTTWSDHAATTAVEWFRRCLGEATDPVLALHHLPTELGTRDFLWATTVVTTNYQRWHTAQDAGDLPHPQPGLRLDRDTQRALAGKHVDELLASPARRIEMMIVYGSKTALVSRFGSQLRDYLGLKRHVLRWHSRPSGSLDPLVFTTDALAADLTLWLGPGDNETMRQLILRLTPKRLVDRIPLLVFDWGTFDDPAGRPNRDDLAEWMGFCADQLARACTDDDLRLLCYLAIELPGEDHGELEEWVEELADEIHDEAFRCTLLPALADVKRGELRNHLTDSTQTTCPPALAREAWPLIFDKTKGRYEETVALIDEGEKHGWNRLLRRLRREARA